MPDTIRRVIVRGRLAGAVETRNMFTYRLAGIAIEPLATTMLTAGVQDIYTSLLPMISPLWSGYQVDQETLVGNQWFPLSTVPATMAGSTAEDFGSFQEALLLTAKTGALRKMGRKFFAGLGEGWTTAGALQTAALVRAATALVAYLTPVSLGGLNHWDPGVVDKNFEFHAFVGGSVGNILSSMRRRKPGYGI